VKVDELPLLDLFARLREADFPLGIDDYQLLLRALQGGFGIGDATALARLCRTLWVKSEDDAHLFDYHFEQVMAEAMVSMTPVASSEVPEEAEEIDISKRPTQPLQQHQATGPMPTVTVEPVLKVEDDVRVAQAMSSAARRDEGAYSAFIATDEYLPVTRRQMKR